jgi:DNA-binding transcriptional ArsR family regulator
MSRTPAHTTPFYAVADPTRRTILVLLRNAEQSASQLTEPFRSSQSAVSQHLAVLRRAKLVTRRREGRRQLYAVSPEPLKAVADWIAQFDQFWIDRPEEESP